MRFIYSIVNKKTKSIYVGVSKNPWRRFEYHHKKGFTGKADFIKNGAELFIESGPHPGTLAAELEKTTIKFYRERGWNVLNIRVGGTLGGEVVKWDFDKCQKIVNKCKYREIFHVKYKTAHNAACLNGWLTDLFKDQPNNGYIFSYDEKSIQKKANLCKTRNELNKKFRPYYKAAQYKGLLNKIFSNHENFGYARKQNAKTN